MQNKIGIPEAAHYFFGQIKNADAIVLSVAEHNGNVTSAFKNLWDWTSRIEQKLWMNKPLFLASTSPGGRGAKSAFDIMQNLLPHYGGNVVASLTLPLFNDNLQGDTIIDSAKQSQLLGQLELFTKAI